MNTYIDESGSFVVPAPLRNSWCVTSALVCPTSETRKLHKTLSDLKRSSGVSHKEEIKLNAIPEDIYAKFLKRLGDTKVALFSTATDSHLNDLDSTIEHRDNQAQSVVVNAVDPLTGYLHPDFEALAKKVKSLSPQLYIQLVIQVQLVGIVLEYGVNYFIQRLPPKTFRKMCWFIDAKDPVNETQFEQAFRVMAPGLLQAFADTKPIIRIEGYDYSYLRDEHNKFELGAVVRDTMFKNSKDSIGLQVVDLLASGTRRLLRNEFKNNLALGALLGRLMVQAPSTTSPIRSFTLKPTEHAVKVDPEVQLSLEAVQANSKSLYL